jgi:hypothetical protein
MKRTLFEGLPSKRFFIGIVLIFLSANFLSAQTRTLRIATYNIEADIDNVTAPLPGLIAPPADPSDVAAGGALEGIGEEIIGNDPAQPLDILTLQETTSNSITVWPINAGLNAFYNSPGMYTNSPYQSFIAGINDGGGPSAVVYNTHTVQLLASVPVDPPGGTSKLGSHSGEYREVMRYEFAPSGVTPTATNEFYVYVSHYKSTANGQDATDQIDRAEEAVIIRTNEAIDLPATARVLYVGDYNVDNSGEVGYQTILSNTAPNGVTQGGGVDPLNLTDNPNINWSASTLQTNILFMLSEHGYALEFRDDLQVMTSNVYYGAPGGLQYVPGSYHVFANNGLIPYKGTVNSGTNTALNSDLAANGPTFLNAATVYLDLTNGSDHLPVVADYSIPIPAPVITGINPMGTNLFFSVADGITGAVYSVLTATCLAPTANWTVVASNVPTTGNFTIIVTNAITPGTPQQFYLLQTR